MLSIHEIRKRKLLYSAATNGHLKAIEYFVTQGLNVDDVRLSYGKSFRIAAANGHLHIINYFISMGINPIGDNDILENSIIDASVNGHTYIINIILHLYEDRSLKFDANILIRVIMCAARYGHIKIIKYMINLGYFNKLYQDIFEGNREIMINAIQCAAQYGQIKVIEYFVNHAKSEKRIKIPDDLLADNNLALKNAAENNYVDVVKYLVQFM